MIHSLQALYAVLVTGSSACHGFTQVPGNTGVQAWGTVILYLYHTNIIYYRLSNQEFRCN